MKNILITGTAGFIGFHTAKLLIEQGFNIHGYDGITDYYDVKIKNERNKILLKNPNFNSTFGMLEDFEKLDSITNEFQPDIIIHLAAQAGVRYSLENPRSYIESNIVGTFNVLEVARKNNVKHFLMASTSSVYGANTNMPFSESENTDAPLTIYSASKKSNEVMAHSYAHLWKIPTTIFRFFTVYGPWGRPDMALFKFVEAILKNNPIDLFNYGEMYRDFTYIDDVVKAISLLLDKIPKIKSNIESFENDDFLSLAPYRIVNMGNAKSVKLIDFISVIENILQKKAIINNLPMQKGDVEKTLSNSTLLKYLTDFSPETDYRDGIKKFVDWYRNYYSL